MAIVETEIEGQRVYIDSETGQLAQAPVNTYGGRVTYRPVQQEGLEGAVITRNVVDTIDGYPASAYKVEPDGRGGLRTFNPKTGQYEQGASRVGMDFGDAGLPVLPPSIGSDFGGSFVSQNAGANNRGGFFEDYALPAIIGGIATAGVGSMLNLGALFGGAGSMGSSPMDAGAFLAGEMQGGGVGLNNLVTGGGATTGGGMDWLDDFTNIVTDSPTSNFGTETGGMDVWSEPVSSGVDYSTSSNNFGDGGWADQFPDTTPNAVGDWKQQLLNKVPNLPAGLKEALQTGKDLTSWGGALKSILGGSAGRSITGLPRGLGGSGGEGGGSWLDDLFGSLGMSGKGTDAIAGILGIGSGLDKLFNGQDPREAAKEYWKNADPYGPNRAGQVNNLNTALDTYQSADPNAMMGDPYARARGMLTGDRPITTDPSYQWRFDQGNEALRRTMAGTGQTQSGAEQLAAIKYGQGAASQEFGNSFGREMSMGGADAARENLMQSNVTGKNKDLVSTYGTLAGATQAPAQAGAGALQAQSQAQGVQNQGMADIMGGVGTMAGTQPAQALARLYNTVATNNIAY